MPKKNIEPKIMYAVMKLNTHVDVINNSTGKNDSIKINGVAGFIPVFDTIEEATKISKNGKYQIIAIQET